MNYKAIERAVKRAYKWVTSLDYTNPTIALSAIAVLLLPMVAKYLVMTALLLGILHAVGILFVLDKAPNSVKTKIKQYPMVSDIVMSFGAVYLLGSFFGEGLTLGLGAIFCTVILSVCIPNLKMRDEPVNNDAAATAAA